MDRQAVQERFGIIGTSSAIRHVIDRAYQIARTDITVLIEGESGVGKELIAQAIHELSPRKHRPLKVINTGAIPEGLIESELFGAEKGSYTGATERRTGLFEEADGGTVFLDEIGEMPPSAQVRLLRVLETGSFNRVGSSTMRKTDTRVVAATNKNLGREVEAGRFREDLYYRLSTVIINVPPLRDRAEDVPLLFDAFLYQFSQKYGTPHRHLDEAVLRLLRQYRWPGNVRELRNVAEQLVVLHRHKSVSAEDMQPLLRGVTAGGGIGMALTPVRNDDPSEPEAFREREVIYRALLEIRLALQDLKKRFADVDANVGTRVYSTPPSTIQDVPLLTEPDGENYEVITYEVESNQETASATGADKDVPLIPTIESTERALIIKALKHYTGNRRQAAKALGISERTLYRKLKGIEDDGEHFF